MADRDPKTKQILSENRLFACLGEPARDRLLGEHSRIESFARGSLIQPLSAGEKDLGLILSGSITVTRKGDSNVMLNRLDRGDVFGLAGLYSEPVSDGFITEIRARTNSVVLLISGAYIKQLVRSDPVFAESYIRYLSDRVRFLNRRIADFTAGDVDSKLARYLAGRASALNAERAAVQTSGINALPSGHNTDTAAAHIDLGDLNISSLAKSLNAGRASVYRALDRLTAKGLIIKTGTGIAVTDPEGLRRAAESNERRNRS